MFNSSRGPKRVIPYLIFLVAAFLFIDFVYSPKKDSRPSIPATVSASSQIEESRKNALVVAIEKVAPAVVNVSTKQTIQMSPFPRDKFFEEFFKDFFDLFPQPRYEQTSLGSGVIISDKGYILTNEHVIRGAEEVIVKLADGRQFRGRLIGESIETDIAVIKIEADNLTVAPMGDSDDLMIGEWAVAIGNPFGLENTVTVGVISATGRALPGGVKGWGKVYQNLIQTDASINPGNSGGPLINANGEVIGINTAIYGKAQGIGFAIPIKQARQFINQLTKYSGIKL